MDFIKDLHIGEKMVLFSLFTSSLCFYPMILGDALPHKDRITDALVNDTISPYFLFSIAITVPMMIEALFDLYFGVLPRKINTCRITLMSALFVYSVLLYANFNNESNAAMYICCTQARSILTTTSVLSFVILEESTAMVKYNSIFLAFLLVASTLFRTTVLFYSTSHDNKFIFLFTFVSFLVICALIILIFTYKTWLTKKKNIVNIEQIFAGISIFIFIAIMLGKMTVFMVIFVTTGSFPNVSALHLSYVKAILVIELIGVLAILIVPGRIVGHYATANKVSCLSFPSPILLYTYYMITGEITVQTQFCEICVPRSQNTSQHGVSGITTCDRGGEA
jgi:hypothetical protein